MQTVHFSAGSHIYRAAIDLVAAAKKHGRASGMFNDIELTATPDTEPDAIVAHYDRECETRATAYKNSPEGKRAAREAQERRTAAQATHDALMSRLPTLDWSDDAAILKWLCDMQQPSDHVGVAVSRNVIVSEFEKRGYRVGENCGKDYKDGDRENMVRYLIGQALDGLKNGPAIHPILHKFAADWRDRFGIR